MHLPLKSTWENGTTGDTSFLGILLELLSVQNKCLGKI